jgi:hypothetical protein
LLQHSHFSAFFYENMKDFGPLQAHGMGFHVLIPLGRISNADSCRRLHHRHPREFMSGVVGNPLKDDLRTTDASAGARPDPLLDRRAFWVISSVRLIVMPVVGIIMTTVCTLFLDLSDTQVLYCSVTSSHL